MKNDRRKEQIKKLQRKIFTNEEHFNKESKKLIKEIKGRIDFYENEIKDLKKCIYILEEEKWIR